MKTRDLVKRLLAAGWRIDRIRGSHHHFKHPERPGLVTVPIKKGADIAPKTLRSILRQAGLER